MKQSKAAIFVLLAGALWGSMGLFVRRLNAAGLYAMDVVLARMLSALLFMGVFMLLFARESFRIRLKDLWCFLGSGIVSLLLFSLCYFSGMQVTSLNVMAVLLYTSPAIIMILSVVLFHEKLTKRKLLALVMTFAGCCLVFLESRTAGRNRSRVRSHIICKIKIKKEIFLCPFCVLFLLRHVYLLKYAKNFAS